MNVERSSFHSATRVRCVLLPVGPVPQAKFDFYASLIERTCATIGLCDVTRDPSHKTLLQHQKWSATSIRYSFLRDCSSLGTEGVALREDLHNDLESFQVHKKILCAIGILHCPSSSDAASDFAAFQTVLKSKYATVTVYRCFAMEKNPSDASGSAEIMEIPVCDDEKTRFYFNTLMQDFTYAVLRSFEPVLALKPGSGSIISTPMDVDVQERSLKLFQQGRLSKIKGAESVFLYFVHI